ncbi:MAG: hypothetical protein LBT01_04245 [Spirochaetaceae bacterium]|jgi:hypothetical protein|nr:hypothetical protein [Spirochaetaceae bacterium]
MEKRIIVIFLALAFIVAGFGFAQEAAEDLVPAPAATAAEPAAPAGSLKLSGSVKTGLRVQTIESEGSIPGSDEVGNTAFDFFNDDIADDDGVNAGRAIRFDLNGLYDADRWGVKFGLRVQQEKFGTTPTRFALREGFAFVNFLDKVINVKAGFIDSNVWNSGGLKNRQLSNSLGVRVEVTPIKGLNVGLLFGSGDMDYGINIDGSTDPASNPRIVDAPVTALEFFKRLTLGASYKNELFYAAAAYKPEGKSKGKPYGKGGIDPSNGEPYGLFDNRDDDSWNNKQGWVENQFILGFGLADDAVENLGLNVEALFVDGFGDASKYSLYRNNINLDVNYTIGDLALTPGLEFYYYMAQPQDIWNETGLESSEFRIYPKAFYEVNENLTIGGFVELFFRTADVEDKDTKADMYKQLMGVAYRDIQLAIKPQIEYKIGNAKIVIFDEAFFLTYYQGMANTLQFDFIYSF